jgi:hypothetical protein
MDGSLRYNNLEIVQERRKQMKLIIAEKPSLARNIGAGIGKMNNRNGYL